MNATPDMYRLRAIMPADIPAVAALEPTADTEPWNAELLSHRLSDPSTLGYIAEINGELAGYLIYARDDLHHQNSILKLAVAPEYETEANSIQQALLDVVKADLSPQGRNTIVVYTDARNDALLDFFSQNQRGFSKHKAAGTDHVMLIYHMPEMTRRTENDSYMDTRMAGVNTDGIQPAPPINSNDFITPPSMDSLPAYMDGLGSYSFVVGSGIPQQEPPSPYENPYENDYSAACEKAGDDMPSPATFRRLSAAALAVGAKARLTELTRMEWETVKLDKRGKLVPATLSSLADGSELYFCTASKVQNPREALSALCAFLGQPSPHSHASRLDRPAQVIIPATWVRQVHLELGAPGKLEQAFIPASTHLRYQCRDELEERKQSKSNSVRER